MQSIDGERRDDGDAVDLRWVRIGAVENAHSRFARVVKGSSTSFSLADWRCVNETARLCHDSETKQPTGCRYTMRSRISPNRDGWNRLSGVTTNTLLFRLDTRDRALLTRLAIGHSAPPGVRLFWLTVTHLGGAISAIALAVLPLLVKGLDRASINATVTLVVSHLLVQCVKRTVGRPRPSLGGSYAALIKAPDRFSFPSGHSAAAMSVAFAYSVAYPPLAAPLLAIAMAVGMSRVALGVHYPGDVFAGQLLALMTGALVIVL